MEFRTTCFIDSESREFATINVPSSFNLVYLIVLTDAIYLLLFEFDYCSNDIS